MHETLEATGHLRRRHTLPTSVLADPGFLVRLAEMKLAPWEVISGPEFAACGSFSPRSLPDWRYFLTGKLYLPEPERKGLFSGNIDYYRIDVLRDWAEGKAARPTDRSRLWVQGADYLKSLGLSRPASAEETDKQLNWVWHNQILHLRTVPKRMPYRPYTGAGNGRQPH